MKAWYNSSWNDVVKELDIDIKKGLSEEKVQENRSIFGENKSIDLKSKSFIRIFIKYITKLYSLSGMGTVLLLSYINEYSTASILLIFILASSIFFSVKDFNNENKIKHITKITPNKALVIRAGKTISINAEELVVGDIVYLEKGDIVPGDLRLIECTDLKIKESAITGNNEIIEKYETKIEDKEISLSEMKNIAFKSSFVIEGRGKGVVVEVGSTAQIDDIIKGLLEVNYIKSEVQDSIFKFVSKFSLIFIVLSISVFIYNISIGESLSKAIDLIVLCYLILVPIELILTISILSFIIKKLMDRRGVKIEGLSSVELLSSANIVFTDKVGTFSEEIMYVDSVYTNSKLIEASQEEIEEDKDNLDRIISIGLLCNDSKINSEIERENLIEKAIIKYGLQKNIDKMLLDKEQVRLFQIPFDMDKRIKTTLNRVEDKYRANVMGAVDKLLDRCTHIMKNGIEVELTAKDIVDIKDGDLYLSLKSLRVVGVAYRNFTYQPSINENIESNLVFVGLIGFENPSKDNVQEIIEYCKTLAIRPIITTEDNKIAAQSFGRRVGILNKNDLVLSGVEMDNMNEAELEKFVERVGIYSKITPKHKWQISSLFSKIGYNLAITGNKFTDLPSFRAAYIGIAMGKECTEIAKKLGDIFVRDNDFLGLVSLIEESRNIIQSIKKIIIFNLISILIEFLCIIVSLDLTGKNIDDLIFFILLNCITTTMGSLIIFMQRNNNEKKRYENVKLNIKLAKSIPSGFWMYMLFKLAIILLMSYMSNTNDLILAKNNFFIILNFSSMILVFYFAHLKDVLRNKVSILIIAVNIIIFSILIKINYFSYSFSIKNIIWNLKILIPLLVLQTFVLKLSKGIGKRI